MSYAFNNPPKIAPTELEPGHGLMPKRQKPAQPDLQAEIAHRLGAICAHGQLARQCELCDRDSEIAQLRAAAEEARRVLSMPLLMKGDAAVVRALRMLDEALGKQDEGKT